MKYSSLHPLKINGMICINILISCRQCQEKQMPKFKQAVVIFPHRCKHMANTSDLQGEIIDYKDVS